MCGSRHGCGGVRQPGLWAAAGRAGGTAGGCTGRQDPSTGQHKRLRCKGDMSQDSAISDMTGCRAPPVCVYVPHLLKQQSLPWAKGVPGLLSDHAVPCVYLRFPCRCCCGGACSKAVPSSPSRSTQTASSRPVLTNSLAGSCLQRTWPPLMHWRMGPSSAGMHHESCDIF